MKEERKMELVNLNWSKTDFKNFKNFLIDNKSSSEKIEWRSSIIKTNLEVLAIYQKDINKITSDILKNSNYKSFLKNTNFIYYEETLIYGKIISSFKDFNSFKKYLNELSLKIDNWATCDNLNFRNMYKFYKEDLFNLSLEYINNKLPFKRRIGLLILFEFINDLQYEKEIFIILNGLVSEEEYYVNMAASWLLCELFVKSRVETLKYYKNNKTNKFIINKSISKCQDSFRVSVDDKRYLLNFKI